jgi:threonine dehydratase
MIGTQKEISVSLQDINEARQRINGKVNRTPLIRFYGDDLPGEIYLKLENLQPIGSFKLRGACNAMSVADRSLLKMECILPVLVTWRRGLHGMHE